MMLTGGEKTFLRQHFRILEDRRLDIREVEKVTGLTRASIRFYEKEGLISPKRRENGYREYSKEDIEQLLRIRLLRNLDVPLPTIRELSEQKLSLREVLRDQQENLNHETREQIIREKLASRIRKEGVSFDRLSGDYYLRIEEELRKEDTVSRKDAGDANLIGNDGARIAYQDPEADNPETHPFRRYFARMTDFAVYSMILESVYFLLMHQRPPQNIGRAYLLLWLFRFMLFVLTMILEPISLHFFGTTFGKWLFGIRILDENGRKLSMQEAFRRTFRVFCFGFAFFIPVYEIVRLILSFRACRRNDTLRWDEDLSECLYTEPGNLRMTGFFAAWIMIAFLSYMLTQNSMLAKHRGDLTISEFVENYNDYFNEPPIDEGRNNLGFSRWLDEDGTFTDQFIMGSNVTDVFSTQDHQKMPEIEYTTEDGFIQEIVISFRQDGMIVDAVPGEGVIAAYAYICAQEGALFRRYRAKVSRFFTNIQITSPEWCENQLMDCENVHLSYMINSEGYSMGVPSEHYLVRDPDAEEAWCEITVTIGRNP